MTAEPLADSVTALPTMTFEPDQNRIDNLDDALAAPETRDVIGMAKGILIATERCSPDEAFHMLRRASQNQNRKLRDIAVQMVARYSGPAPRLDARPDAGPGAPLPSEMA